MPLGCFPTATGSLPEGEHDVRREDRRVPTDDYCYITTTGRRTGRPHRIEIWYAGDGDTLSLLAGGGRSADWVRNLLVRPDVSVEIAGEMRSARGRVLEDG